MEVASQLLFMTSYRTIWWNEVSPIQEKLAFPCISLGEILLAVKIPPPALMTKAKMKIAQYAMIVKNDKLLVLQFSDYVHEFLNEKWTLPGGHLEYNEDPLKSLKREVSEETGLDINNIMPACIYAERYVDKRERYIVIYSADATGHIRLSKEHIDYKWIKEMRGIEFASDKMREKIKYVLKNR